MKNFSPSKKHSIETKIGNIKTFSLYVDSVLPIVVFEAKVMADSISDRHFSDTKKAADKAI